MSQPSVRRTVRRSALDAQAARPKNAPTDDHPGEHIDAERRFTPVAPSDLARRTRTVWQSRRVPPSSGPLATHRRSQDQAASSFIRPLRRPTGTVSPPLDLYGASWRTAPPRKSRGGLEDRIRPGSFTVLPLQPDEPTSIIAGRSRSFASVDLGLLHRAAQRTPVDSQLLTDPATSAGHRQLRLIIGR